MRESSAAEAAPSIEKRGNGLPPGATGCTTSIHARFAREAWPDKTAEHWAAAAGRKPRIAKYWLAGGKVSADGKLALIRLLS